MLQFIDQITNSKYFIIGVAIWFFIALIKISSWQSLLKRIIKISKKPWIFSPDPQDDSDLVYPRKFLEQLVQSKNSDTGNFGKFLANQSDQLFDHKYPFRTISYVVILAFCTLFILGDVIAASQTLQLLQMEVSFLPESLNQLSISLLAGGVLAAVIGLWILIEASGDADKPSKTLPFDDYNKVQLRIIKTFSILIFIFSIAIAFAFAQQGMISMGVVETTPTTILIVNYVLFGVLLINNFLAAAISFTFAIQGALVILIILVKIIINFLPVIVFILDVVWRVAHIIIDTAVTFLLTPFLVLTNSISGIFQKILPNSQPPSPPRQ